eukprot:TRINITY_DN72420_c0_g1_i1.p1 TRINITY_DN72420_c0_g1~~TRINITY_DN72420_c0_g1_i1.p1  ORF type:complete len:170 (+),score=23.08 TRINITY_DN72420_c0_g1_i1:61-570(+)
MMGSIEEILALASASGACSIAVTALLSLLDLPFAASFLRSGAEVAILLLSGLVCLQGETRLFYTYHEVVLDNFGFALKTLGRGATYLLAGLYCTGSRIATTAAAEADAAAAVSDAGEGATALFSLLWYACCLLMFVASAASVWTWHGERRAAIFGSMGGSDVDAFYISS